MTGNNRSKNKLQIIVPIAVILLLPILGSCTNEYISYHEDIFGPSQKETIMAFSGQSLKERDVTVRSTPDKEFLKELISIIDSAKSRVYVEVYILTEKDIIKSLKQAKQRGIDVKVILEKNVFGAGNINKKTLDSLKGSGIDSVYAKSENYRFTHAKFMIIDDGYVISTGNFSHASFVNNVELFVIGKDSGDLAALMDIFMNDFLGTKLVKCYYPLVISPKCPRSELEYLINSTRKTLYVYAETFDDENLMMLLKKKKEENVDVKILLGDMAKIRSNKAFLGRMRDYGIDIKAPKKPYIHAKMMISDDDAVYIGSVNFTNNSIENNREIGLLFKNREIIGGLKNEFLTIFSNSQ